MNDQDFLSSADVRLAPKEVEKPRAPVEDRGNLQHLVRKQKRVRTDVLQQVADAQRERRERIAANLAATAAAAKLAAQRTSAASQRSKPSHLKTVVSFISLTTTRKFFHESRCLPFSLSLADEG